MRLCLGGHPSRCRSIASRAYAHSCPGRACASSSRGDALVLQDPGERFQPARSLPSVLRGTSCMISSSGLSTATGSFGRLSSGSRSLSHLMSRGIGQWHSPPYGECLVPRAVLAADRPRENVRLDAFHGAGNLCLVEPPLPPLPHPRSSSRMSAKARAQLIRRPVLEEHVRSRTCGWNVAPV